MVSGAIGMQLSKDIITIYFSLCEREIVLNA